jgi:hypothetical protein
MFVVNKHEIRRLYVYKNVSSEHVYAGSSTEQSVRTIQTACILRKNRLHEGKHRASVKCVNIELIRSTQRHFARLLMLFNPQKTEVNLNHMNRPAAAIVHSV